MIDNRIGDEGSMQLAKHLKANPILSKINLSGMYEGESVLKLKVKL